jgi:hypothetical protein
MSSRTLPWTTAAAIGLSVLVTACGTANRPPKFPLPFKYEHSTSIEYDKAGNLTGAITTAKVSPAQDPDGDTVTYTWTVEPEGAGRVTGNGTTVTWQRVVEDGRLKPGTLRVLASDGKGGQDRAAITFEG